MWWEGFATIMGWGSFLSVVGKVPVNPLDANCVVVKRGLLCSDDDDVQNASSTCCSKPTPLDYATRPHTSTRSGKSAVERYSSASHSSLVQWSSGTLSHKLGTAGSKSPGQESFAWSWLPAKPLQLLKWASVKWSLQNKKISLDGVFTLHLKRLILSSSIYSKGQLLQLNLFSPTYIYVYDNSTGALGQPPRRNLHHRHHGVQFVKYKTIISDNRKFVFRFSPKMSLGTILC